MENQTFSDAELAASPERLTGYLGELIRQCEDHLEYQQADYRELSLNYYAGKLIDLPPEEGQSRAVSNDLRAAYRKIMPSIIRTFLSNGRLVEYLPNGPGTEQMAQQATDYVNQVIVGDPDCGVESAIQDAVFDALIIRTGILTWDAIETKRAKVYYLDGLDQQQLAFAQQEGAEIIDVEQYMDESQPQQPQDPNQPPPDPTRYNVTLKIIETDTKIMLNAVPRGSFLIMPDVDRIEDSPLVGEIKMISRSDLIERGYDPELVANITGKARPRDGERYDDDYDYKQEDYDEYSRREVSRSMEEVLVYDVYVRLDRDGDGVAEMHHMVLGEGGGDGARDAMTRYIILQDEPCSDAPYAKIIAERSPHQFEGHSLSEDIIPIQRVKTWLLRATLDNINMQNWPRPAIDLSTVVDEEAIINPRPGNPVLLKPGSRVQDAIQYLQVPFVGEASFSMWERLDELVREHTGVTDASGGVELEKLQSMSPLAAGMIHDVGAQTAEWKIRTLGRGIRDAFRGILRLVVAHATPNKFVKLHGDWVPFDPTVWDSEMDCKVNVGVGSGSKERDMQALGQIQAMYQYLIESMGLPNHFLKASHVYELFAKQIEALGFPDPSQFIQRPDDEAVEQEVEEAKQSEPPSPEEVKMQVEQQKMALEQQKAQSAAELQMMKFQSQVQVERTQAEADVAVKQAELQARMASDQTKANIDKELKMLEFELKLAERHAEMKREQELHMVRMGMDVDKAEVEAEIKERQAAQKMEIEARNAMVKQMIAQREKENDRE